MAELGLALFLLVVALLVIALVWYARQQRKDLIALVEKQGWQWLGDVSEADVDLLPQWFEARRFPQMRVLPHHKATYHDVFEGSVLPLQILAFKRQTRRRRGRSDTVHDQFLLIRDAQLSEQLPDFHLVRSHPLTDTLVSYAENVTPAAAMDFRIRSDIPGYDDWRVHTTSLGAQWLASPPGQQLAQRLAHFDPPAQHAFGVSGQVIVIEGADLSAQKLQAQLEEAMAFYSLLQLALENPTVRKTVELCQ